MSAEVPHDPDIEQIHKLAAHHYFQTLVNEEVKKRTDEQLQQWWRRVAATIGIVVAILGAFGIKAAYDLGVFKEEAKSQLATQRMEFDAQKASYAERLSEVQRLASNTTDTIDDANATIKRVESEQGINNDRLFGLMNQSQERMRTITGNFGEISGRFTTREEELEKRSDEIGKSLATVRDDIARGEGIQRRLEDEAQKRDTQYAQIEANVTNSVQKRIGGLERDVNDVRNRVFSRGTYVIREKVDNVIQPDGTDVQLVISTKQFSESKLVLVAITDGSKALLPAQDLNTGGQMKFRAGGYEFELSLRYIREIPMTPDDAQIELVWSKTASPVATLDR